MTDNGWTCIQSTLHVVLERFVVLKCTATYKKNRVVYQVYSSAGFSPSPYRNAMKLRRLRAKL